MKRKADQIEKKQKQKQKQKQTLENKLFISEKNSAKIRTKIVSVLPPVFPLELQKIVADYAWLLFKQSELERKVIEYEATILRPLKLKARETKNLLRFYKLYDELSTFPTRILVVGQFLLGAWCIENEKQILEQFGISLIYDKYQNFTKTMIFSYQDGELKLSADQNCGDQQCLDSHGIFYHGVRLNDQDIQNRDEYILSETFGQLSTPFSHNGVHGMHCTWDLVVLAFPKAWQACLDKAKEQQRQPKTKTINS